ncbi:MAG: DUF3575 domain-containing protein [Muribaculaceae bacterium]|nr:DUF3575 domain-containing protein [Muribaculaceae bacterium]
MRYEIRIILASVLMTILTLQVFGETPSDSVKVYFRAGHRQFDPALDNNGEVMANFIEKVRKANLENNIASLVVSGYASPDGISTANERLSLLRCQTIADYISEHTGVERNFIETIPYGVAWAELHTLVYNNPDVPDRTKILDIIENVPIWVFNREGTIVDGRKKQLMNLDGGNPYRWMLKNIFPELRNAVAVTMYLKSEHNKTSNHPLKEDEINPNIGGDNTGNTKEVPDNTNETIETIVINDENETNATTTTNALNAQKCDEASNSAGLTKTHDETVTNDIHESTGEREPLHRFALKSNLLYDAALLPNIEIEWMIKDKWSVAIEGDIAWWRNKQKHKYYDLAMVSAEGRRWFAVKKPWHGFYAGVFAGVGKYDFENGGKGYYGEGAMTGVSAGYTFPISRCLSFEASIGAGYMRTQYKEYIPVDGHYIYQRTKSLNYFGPLKLKFAIAWRFFDVNKRKAAQ